MRAAGCPHIQLNSDTIYQEIVSGPTGEVLHPTKLLPPPPISDTSCKPRCHLRFWPTCYGLEVPTASSFILINFLEWLIELRETFYLLGYQFIMKGYNSGTVRQKRCLGQGTGKGHRAPMCLQARHAPSPSMWSPTQKLSKLHTLAFLLRRFHYIGMVN